MYINKYSNTYVRKYRVTLKVTTTTLQVLLSMSYRMAQNFDRENIDEFDKFPAIRQYFPYQNFPFS